MGRMHLNRLLHQYCLQAIPSFSSVVNTDGFLCEYSLPVIENIFILITNIKVNCIISVSTAYTVLKWKIKNLLDSGADTSYQPSVLQVLYNGFLTAVLLRYRLPVHSLHSIQNWTVYIKCNKCNNHINLSRLWNILILCYNI